ncbi:MAG: D-alanyl-D-alanine carboxypeptidase, partial [Hyphomicrobiales bacterium]|nr:D-alanyl-D-alanine carboxypeptidase [Hyphomicrobiales bacterium]
AKLAFRIVEGHPDRMRYFSIPDFTWSKIRQVNKNLLLAANVGADGFKIAKFDKSAALVGTATRDGRRLVVVLMGARDAKQASDDAARLIEWGFSGFTAKALFKKNEIVGSAQVYGGASGSVPLAVERDLVGMAPRGAGAGRLTGRIDYRGPLAAPVSAGVEVARLKVYGGDQLVLDAPLRTAAAVAAGPLPIRAWDSAVEYVTGRIRKAFAKIQ